MPKTSPRCKCDTLYLDRMNENNIIFISIFRENLRYNLTNAQNFLVLSRLGHLSIFYLNGGVFTIILMSI
jgi:hypothetical protein